MLPIALLVGTMLAIQFGFFTMHIISQQVPNIPRLHGEEIAEGTWVVYAGNRYTIWDVTENKQLIFMAATPSNSLELVRDQEVLSHIFAIRLALHAAEIVNAITSVEQNVQTVQKTLATASSMINLMGEREFANELRGIESEISKNTKFLVEISQVLEMSKPYAKTLVEEHTDKAANTFLNFLILSAAVSRSRAATVVVSLMTTSPQFGLVSGWIDSFLLLIDSSLSPLEALAKTYGALQSSATIQNLRLRGV